MLATITRSLALAATLAAGTATAAEIKVFQVPEGAGPHDVAPAPDGKVWFSAQGSGALGIIDPATGEVGKSHLARARRRTASFRVRTVPRGSPMAASTPSSASILGPRR